jgi:hypothetical protein
VLEPPAGDPVATRSYLLTDELDAALEAAQIDGFILLHTRIPLLDKRPPARPAT